MPIYAYRCTDCGHELDALQKLSDEPLKDCPQCGNPTLRKAVTAPAFRLKGSGWYETDFKSSGKRNVADSGGSSSSDSSSGSSSSSSDSGSAAAN